MDQFAHLHLHTQYSLLDGANKIGNVISRAHELGQPAIAITDHGNLHGAVEFYTHAKNVGIKPIIGCELYVAGDSRHDRTTKAQGGKGTFHLTVLAQNMEGYRNLCRLSSMAYKEGFYFKPRVDHELLEKYSEGLIVLSGCLSGEFSHHVGLDDRAGAKKTLEFFLKTFKDRYYLEVQPHQIPEQQRLNQGCIDLAKEMGVPLVATTDCHYCDKEDHYAQEVLMCISTGKLVTDPDRLRHDGVDLHLKTAQEMREGFGAASWAPEAVANSLRIAESCGFTFDFKTYFMPRFSDNTDDFHEQQMEKNAREGMELRFKQLASRMTSFDSAQKQKYIERLDLELKLIRQMGFASYFLVVSDFIVWAKENNIPVGPGRGSAAGSLVAYAMRITDVDPIVNKLLFERFLNPERVSLPDIDVDFCIYGREKVIQYVVEKYGKDKVAQISTFGTMKAKAALKDVGRALGLSYAETDRVAQLVPAPRQGFDYPLAEAIKMEPKLAEYAAGPGKDFITLAMKLEGLTRHSSTHAAGVVIGDRPLMELLPMMVDKDGNDVTQYSMNYVEKCGLVKFDFLGLKTLTVIDTSLKIIEQSSGVKIDLELLPLEDPKTYSLLSAGNTTGVFQLESSGITEMTMRLKPNSFDDLVAILALYRPGPLDAGMVDHYILRKHGKQAVTYLHPLMKNVLSDTYGIMLYQEQIMQLARELAGYSLAEADLLRKAMGKKNPEEMKKQRDRFLSGAKEKGIDKKLSDEIFNQMETFARYGFNRSHSVAYAMVSFQTAYLKAHYGVEFMAALMSHEMGDSEKTLKNLTECRKQKIQVLPPDVNKSIAGFSVADQKIHYGLEAVKGIGEKAVVAILDARNKEGPFTDFEDMLTRIDIRMVNRRVVENLIKCGAFDFSKVSRRQLWERLEDCLKSAQGMQRDKDSNQISLFGGTTIATGIPRSSVKIPEWPVNQKLGFEREALGFYISGHPLEKFQRELKKIGTLSTVEVKKSGKRAEVKVAGVVTGLRLRNTKKGDRYASFVLEDNVGTIDALVWPEGYKTMAALISSDEPVIAIGRPDITDERSVLIIEKMEALTELRDRSATHGILNLTEKDQSADQHTHLLRLFSRFSGPCPVKVKLDLEKEEVSFVLKDRNEAPVRVMPSEQLCNEVEQLYGRPVLFFY